MEINSSEQPVNRKQKVQIDSPASSGDKGKHMQMEQVIAGYLRQMEQVIAGYLRQMEQVIAGYLRQMEHVIAGYLRQVWD